MPNRVRILFWRVRRRPLLLLLFAAVWLVYGIATYFDPPLPPPSPHFYTPLLGPALFVPTGLLGAWAATTSRPTKEYIGFGALHLAVALWILNWVIQWIDGYPRAWSSVLVWSLVLAILSIIAGWPEPPGYSPRFIEALRRERHRRMSADQHADAADSRATSADHRADAAEDRAEEAEQRATAAEREPPGDGETQS